MSAEANSQLEGPADSSEQRSSRAARSVIASNGNQSSATRLTESSVEKYKEQNIEQTTHWSFQTPQPPDITARRITSVYTVRHAGNTSLVTSCEEKTSPLDAAAHPVISPPILPIEADTPPLVFSLLALSEQSATPEQLQEHTPISQDL